MRQKKLIVATIICLALITYATLTQMAGRPVLAGHNEPYWIVLIERVGAFGLLGGLLAALFPRKNVATISAVVATAILLEALQLLIPTRDAAVLDVIEKAAGGITGILLTGHLLTFPKRQ